MRLLEDARTWVSNQRSLLDICNEQRDLIAELQRLREKDDLEHVRFQRDLMTNFRAALEQPDLGEVEEALEKAISDLSDHVARLEEHLA